MKNFLKTKAYYLILLGCVVALCIGGVVVLQDRASDKDPIIAKNTSTPKPQVTPKSPSSATATEVPSNVDPINNPKTAHPTATPQVSPNVVKMSLPLEGDILVGYAANKLVYNKTTKDWRTHPAIDIVGEAGSEVKCAYAGTVEDIKYDPTYGLVVIVDHGNDLRTIYCGLTISSDISEGSVLSKDDVIGKLGNELFAEKADGTHLHFEVVQNGKKVDPGLFLDLE